MARFATFTVGSQVIVIPRNLEYQWPGVPENNYVDTLVHAKLQKLRMVPSDICTDEEFLRRVFIDVVGQLPTSADYDKFMTSTDPEKRAKLVDELLGRKEFTEIWVMKFAELLQIRTTLEVSYKSMLLYFNWLQDKIASNTPMNVIVQELLSANGGTFKSPPPTTTRSKRTPSRSPKTSPRSSWECESSALSAITTRSTAGR